MDDININIEKLNYVFKSKYDEFDVFMITNSNSKYVKKYDIIFDPISKNTSSITIKNRIIEIIKTKENSLGAKLRLLDDFIYRVELCDIQKDNIELSFINSIIRDLKLKEIL